MMKSKKVTSFILVVAMIASMVCTPVMAATIVEGTNGTTTYISLSFTSDANGNNAIESVDKDASFFIFVNFGGNPTELERSIQGYNLYIGYDAEKVSFVSKTKKDTDPTWNAAFTTGVAYAGWASTDGIVTENDEGDSVVMESGCLFRIKATALGNLSKSDLNAIRILDKVPDRDETTKILGRNESLFTLVQAPALTVSNVSGNVYSDATAEDIKDLIGSIEIIDETFASTTYTQNNAEWSDLSVALPSAGLVVGKNTLTASYNGYECAFEITVLDRVESIAVTTPPTKTTYTAFETFDKTGMVVTATYESGETEDVTADCVVDTTTALKVADTSWTITYGDKQTAQAITVNPKQVTVPVVSGAGLVYDGSQKEIAYSVAVDAEYVSVTGETRGKNAKTYTAVASLKDKANTVWASGDGNADVPLSWTIGKATITSGIAPMTKKYTATYAELPAEATVTGISENITADIQWYTDAAWTQPASGSAQIAASYTGAGQTVTLYYVASGMDNYNDYKGSVVVSVTDKDAGTVTWTNVMNGWTYNNKTATGTYSESGYTISVDMFTVKDSRGNILSGDKTVTVKNESGDSVTKITDVGTYIITVSYEDKDNKALDTFTAVVNPKSIEGLAVSLKIGDGDATQTSSSNPLTCTYTGSEIAPVVAGVSGVAEGNYAVDGQAQGTTLTATNVSDGTYSIAVKGTGNYTGTAYGYWKIVPAEIQVSGAVVAEKGYNGNTNDANITSVTFAGLKGSDSLEKDEDYTVTNAVYANANAGENVSVTFAVALTNTQKAKNYTLTAASGSATGRITKAAAPALSAAAVQTLLSENVVSSAKDYTFDLTRVVSGIPADAGNVTYAVKTEGTYVKKIGTGIERSALTVQVAQPQAATVTDAVVITVSSTNYMDADVTVNFEFKNKTSVTITLGNVTATYGDAYTVAGSYANQPQSGYEWTYTYEGIEGTDYAANTEKPTKAGTYRITAHYEDNTPDSQNPEIPGHIGEATATLTINKKSLTVLPGDVVVTKVYDETTNAGTLTGTLALSGTVGNDEVYVDMLSNTIGVGAYSAANVGTYTVEIGGLKLGGADKDNYSISETYAFAGAKITKQVQSALTINGGSDNISKVYGDDAGALVVAGGNGTGAVSLTSSDSSILSLTASGAGTWQATIRKVGTVTLTATKQGDNNYEAATALEISFVITEKEIAAGDFTIDTTDKVYTNGEIKPEVSSQLNASTDYDVVYSNNVNIGTAIIKITGKDNFKGEVIENFTIIPKEISDAEFTVSGLAAEYTYTGQSIAPMVDVKWGNILLVSGTDYSVNYADNTNAGTATITISGLGNYSGTLEKTFEITPAAYTGVVTITKEDGIDGVQLTAQAPAGGILSYQWMRDGEPITNANGNTYLTVQLEDAGKQISVQVTSTGNYAGMIESAPIDIDKAFLPGTVTLSGTTELTATITDAPAEEHYDIVWMRDGAVIAGVIGTTYTVQEADKGCEITVKLVAKGDTYTGEMISSPVSVPAEAPSFATAPTVTVGNSSLTVAFSAKANGSAITQYQILVDGNAAATLDGAQNSYTITNLVNGTQYAIKVVAINAIGSTESAEVTATPSAPSGGSFGGGGGGAPVQYQISSKTPVGGKVSLSDKRATAGKVVTVTITPDEGYEVAEVIVLDKNGKKVSVTKDGDVYTFTMPQGAITVDAEFKKVEEKPEEKPGEVPAIEFADVSPTSYYGDAVKWAVENDVTKGTGANQFSPDAECTRAEMVTFLWRAAGSPKAKNAETKFTDIDHGSYYYDAVLWAVENGITTGITETTFSPTARVNRAQTVTFLWRLANAPVIEGDSQFTDVKGDSYYESAVKWAVNESVTNGITELSFGPEDACTRAQIVTFLYRYFVK